MPETELDASLFKDEFTQKPLAEEVEYWRKLVDRLIQARAGHIFGFYLACPNADLLEGAKKCVVEELGPGEIIEWKATSEECNLFKKIEDLEEGVGEGRDDRIIMVVKNFEQIVARYATDDYSFSRLGHDWYQNVRDADAQEKLFGLLGKNVIIVTLIGDSLGGEAYKKALETAAGGRDFYNGFFEVA